MTGKTDLTDIYHSEVVLSELRNTGEGGGESVSLYHVSRSVTFLLLMAKTCMNTT